MLVYVSQRLVVSASVVVVFRLIQASACVVVFLIQIGLGGSAEDLT